MGCVKLPRMDMFGKIDAFLVFEVKDPETNKVSGD